MNKYIVNSHNSITNLLFLLHLPPPVHGSSMVGQWIKDSKIINENFFCNYINLLASKSVSDSGKLSIRKILGFVRTWFLLLKHLIFSRPHICYMALSTTGAAFYKDFTLVLLLKIFRVKIIYHLHNKGIIIASQNKFNRQLYRYAFKNTKVILLSEYLYSDVSTYIPLTDILICSNGIPELDITFSEKKEDGGFVQILFLSNLIKSKGVLTLLHSMSLLQNRGVIFKGVFVGGEADIDANHFHMEVQRLGLKKVAYLGKKFGEAKEFILKQSDIFAFPTFYDKECFPLVLLEAMQHGLPVVATPEGGIADIVEEGVTGYLVPQDDVIALADKLELLIQDSELRTQMGKAGRNKYERHYTLNHFENRLVSILRSV